MSTLRFRSGATEAKIIRGNLSLPVVEVWTFNLEAGKPGLLLSCCPRSLLRDSLAAPAHAPTPALCSICGEAQAMKGDTVGSLFCFPVISRFQEKSTMVRGR